MYYDQMHYIELYRQQNKKLFNDMKKAITLKFNAIHCYTELSKIAPDNSVKTRILKIREDDVKHLRLFTEIYRALTGSTIEPKVTEVFSGTFEKGIENAFQNEQVDSRFYLQISDETDNQAVRNVFYRAAGEDQIHANWFLFYMIKQR